MHSPTRSVMRASALGLISLLVACAGPAQHPSGTPSSAAAEPPALRGADRDHDAADATDSDEIAASAAGLLALQRLTAGAEALADGHAEEALLLLQSVAPGSAAESDRRFLCGVALMQLGRHEEALIELRAAAELQPDDISTHCVLARVLRTLGDVTSAVAELQAAVALDEGDAHLRTLLGHMLLEQGDLASAYDELLLAVDIDPSAVDAHRGLALVFATGGDPEHAARAWRLALTLAPDDAALHAGLASSLRSQGLHDEALTAYTRAAELQPGNAVHRANAASTLVLLGRLTEAREAFWLAVQVDMVPGIQRALIHANHGELLERLGDVDGAVEAYETALADVPELSTAREALGLLLLDTGDTEGALYHLEQALNSGGLTAEGMLHLALQFERRGDAPAARSCARLLADDDSGRPEVAFRRAQLLVLSADAEIRDLPTAVDLLRELSAGAGEDNSAVWNLLGEALAKQGAFAGAVEAASRAVELVGPDHPAVARYRSLREQYLSRLAGR